MLYNLYRCGVSNENSAVIVYSERFLVRERAKGRKVTWHGTLIVNKKKKRRENGSIETRSKLFALVAFQVFAGKVRPI